MGGYDLGDPRKLHRDEEQIYHLLYCIFSLEILYIFLYKFQETYTVVINNFVTFKMYYLHIKMLVNTHISVLE